MQLLVGCRHDKERVEQNSYAEEVTSFVQYNVTILQ